MISRFRKWLKNQPRQPSGSVQTQGSTGGATRFQLFLDRVILLLRLPAPDTPQLLRRIRIMERDVVLPIKVAGIAMLVYSFYLTPWMGLVLSALDIAVETTQYFLWIYVGINIVGTIVLLSMRHLPLALIEWTVFTISLVDGMFLACLTLVTGGYDSILYWLFLGLIVRGAISVPRATAQLTLNLTLSAYYIVAGLIDISLAKYVNEAHDERGHLSLPILDHSDDSSESLVLRLVLLLLMTLSCYAIQVLLERQRRTEEETREFAFREGQLRASGRLAAEIAHQIKNPLAIINNAAYSLQRALRDGKGNPTEHIGIIQEEVERSDRIITQVMGYAQLSEGHVERLDLREELEQAIAQVFPAGAGFTTKVHRDFGEAFPPLFMLRRHVSETLINLLQNAREAVQGTSGNIFVKAFCREDKSTEVSIADDGAGVSEDKRERIFEPYYTTKEKGTGLGLATVKHNMELYGGSITLESELGKGSRFTLIFPARTMLRTDSHR